MHARGSYGNHAEVITRSGVYNYKPTTPVLVYAVRVCTLNSPIIIYAVLGLSAMHCRRTFS